MFSLPQHNSRDFILLLLFFGLSSALSSLGPVSLERCCIRKKSANLTLKNSFQRVQQRRRRRRRRSSIFEDDIGVKSSAGVCKHRLDSAATQSITKTGLNLFITHHSFDTSTSATDSSRPWSLVLHPPSLRHLQNLSLRLHADSSRHHYRTEWLTSLLTLSHPRHASPAQVLHQHLIPTWSTRALGHLHLAANSSNSSKHNMLYH